MKRKRILTVLIVLALVFIWGNSLVSRELSGKISDDILFFLNAAEIGRACVGKECRSRWSPYH